MKESLKKIKTIDKIIITKPEKSSGNVILYKYVGILFDKTKFKELVNSNIKTIKVVKMICKLF